MEFIMEYIDYTYLKAFHYLAFISWMAMLFYLPRLFVYHAEHIEKKEFVEVVKIQEDKLYNFIGWPAMIATVVSGVLMLFMNMGLFKVPHIHVKLTLAILLLVYHFDNGRYLKQFRENRCKKSGKFFRAYNEVPTLIMIGIIYVMIANPF